jgi:hypothetical protein
MNDHTPDLLRRDPHISVEAAEPETVPATGWVAPARRTLPAPVPNAYCHHHIRFRHLRARGWLQFIGAIAALTANWLVVSIGVVAGTVALVLALFDGTGSLVFVAFLLAFGAALMAVGNVALAVTWGRFHRPSDTVIVLDSIGFLLFSCGIVLFAARSGVPVLALLAVPGAVVTAMLWRFRSVLYHRSSCADYPWFPPSVLAILREHRVETVDVAAESWIEACTHVVRFRDLRPRHRIAGIGFSMLYVVYLLAFAVELIALLGLWAGSFITGREAVALTVVAVVSLPLVIVGLVEYFARAKRLHRAPTPVYVLAISGFVGSAALAAWMAMITHDLLFYGFAALAVVPVLSATSAARSLTRRSECRSNPGLPPKIQEMLKV